MRVVRACKAGILGLAAAIGQAAAQIPDVAPVCADRPAATGRALTFERPAPGESREGKSSSDLRCVDLTPTAAGGDAVGVVEMARSPSPFNVSVTADGHHEYDLTAWLSGLPDPTTLGPSTTYVAWATPLELDPVVKLGEVSNGRNRMGRVAFNKFLILVSAEVSGDVREREGRLVLRGRSPSARMEAHDLLAQAPSAVRVAKTPDSIGMLWNRPPGYEGVPMLPGIMGLRPRVRPLVPSVVDAASLPLSRPSEMIELPDGGTLDLTADFVRREIAGQSLVMLAFNAQHPGPLLKVREGSTIFVNFTNHTTMPTAVHWHGLRLDNRFDGVPGVTQDPVGPGETFRYQVFFPDAGIYWYHPHHREDVQQELGLYGNMLVDPLEADYYGPVNREEVLMLDDLLLGDGIVPFGDESASHSLMGRFGNVMLVNGEPEYSLDVQQGEVVRFFLTNASNTRTWNLSFTAGTAGARTRPRPTSPSGPPSPPSPPIKIIASDVSRFEREEMVRSVVLAPAERYVVEVQFDTPGSYALMNRVQGVNHRMGVFLPEYRTLGAVNVSAAPVTTDHGLAFAELRQHASVVTDIDRYRSRFADPPDHRLELSLDVNDLPEAVEQSMYYDWVYFNPVEWTGTMPMMNWVTSGREIRWTLRDAETGRENMDIDWRFAVGDVVKIRVTNRRDGFHVMQHPLHFHGQRFLVIEQDGVRPGNLVWKDTVLLPSGSTTDILLELSNPGRWMVHCHIAEHLEAGMKFVMNVERN